MKPSDRLSAASILACAALFLIGCGGSPSAANIELRKQNEQLSQSLTQAKSERDANAATIKMLQAQATTVQMLPQERIANLVTVHQIRLGRLTAIKPLAASSSSSTTSQSSAYILEVHAAPLDETGDSIKASGSFTVDAFDLSKHNNERLGHWEFSTAQARTLWLSGLLVYEYVLPCPLNFQPKSDQHITVRLTYTDELTHRVFEAQTQITGIHAEGASADRGSS